MRKQQAELIKTKPGRYEAWRLPRRRNGFEAIIIDTKHPSGASRVQVLSCKTADEAAARVNASN